MLNGRLSFALLICVLFFVSSICYAQATLSGSVNDPDGAAVPGIQFRLEQSGNTVVQSVSDAEGRFRILRIPPGRYLVHVDAEKGFAEYVSEVVVTDQSPQNLLIKLQLASISQDVVVAPDQTQLSPDSQENQDQVRTDAAMLEHVPVFDQNYITALIPFLDATGLATSGVSIVVDGVEMKGTGVSASAIAEARINSDPYSVETNRPGRGRIEIITKPGSPELHGSLNFTFRDSITDAKNYFALTRPFEQKRIYEGSITGPAAFDHHTTFLLSGSRSEDNLQSVVHAILPQGLISANVPAPVHDTEFAARIAHDFSSAHRVSLQYNASDAVSRHLGVGGLVLNTAAVNSQSREDDVIFNDRMIVTPSLLNQLQLFYEKDHDPARSESPLPKIVVDGSFTGGGAQADILQTENNLKINDVVSWTRHRHYIKFGINIPNISRRAWEDHSNRLGTYSFGSLADYLNGTPDSFTQQVGPGRVVFWMNELGAFVQDQVQIRNNLQLSWGVRYDWQTYFKSAHDFAPRASIAYNTNDRKLVLRAGMGVYYDRSGAQPMADLKRYNGTIIHEITLLNPEYPIPYAVGQNASNFPTVLVVLEPGGRLPYITNFSVGLERQLIKGLTLAATYRGTIGVALFRSRDVNAPQPPLYSGRPNPQFATVRQIESEGRQIGNALDLTVQGKTQYFSGIAQYTLSRTDNNTGGITWFPANQYSMAGEYARSDLDQRNRLNLLGTINEEGWLNLGVSAKLYSGLPYTETAGADLFHTGMLNGRPAGVARNSQQGTRTAELDLRWGKAVAISPRQSMGETSLGFDVSAFNLTNTTSFTGFVGNVRSGLFRQPTSAMPARRLQFGIHFKF